MRNTTRPYRRCRNLSDLLNQLYEDLDRLEMCLDRSQTFSSADKNRSAVFYNQIVEGLQTFLQKKLRRASNRTDTKQYTTLRQLIIDHCVENLKNRHCSDSSSMERPSEPSRFASEKVSKYIPRVDKVERKLEKVLSLLAEAGQDDDDEDYGRSRFPNLKYAQPKYQNLESVIKHVEDDNNSGGFKLVLMNFND